MTSIYLFAFVGGAWLLQQQSILPDLTGATVLVPLAVAWILFSRRSGAFARALCHVVVILTFAATGFFWAAAVGSWKLADELGEIWEGRDVEVAGVVAEMVQPNERGIRFLFDVERTYTLNARIPSRVSLMWYASDGEPAPDLHAGQRWRATVRLHKPHGNANPDGFDFEAWMLERGIRAVGYLRTQPAPHLIETQYGVRAICWNERGKQHATICGRRWVTGPMRGSSWRLRSVTSRPFHPTSGRYSRAQA